MSKYRIMLDGKAYEIEVEKISEEEEKKQEALIEKNEKGISHTRSYKKEVNDSLESKIKVVKSNMPGTIIRILAQNGDKVIRGQAVMVVEAMKMEMNIQAPADGVVASLYFNERDTVQGGMVLFEVVAG